MRRLHNQTNKPLSWKMDGKHFVCDPFGQVDIPDELMDAVRVRGLPLSVSPIPSETKAKTTLDEEQKAARSDELRLLKIELEKTRASEAVAKDTAEKLQAALSKAQTTVEQQADKLSDAKASIETLTADKEALAATLEETVRKLQFAEDLSNKVKAEALASADPKKTRAPNPAAPKA